MQPALLVAPALDYYITLANQFMIVYGICRIREMLTANNSRWFTARYARKERF